MSGVSYSLSDLPDHILIDIASRSSKSTLWSLMETSRAVRAAAEVALKPHLATLRVLEDPPYFPSAHRQDGSIRLEDDDTRHTKLCNKHKRLRSHFDAYPPSLSLIRDLTLEVRDDCDVLGWQLVKRLADRLERLKLQIRDRYREKPEMRHFISSGGDVAGELKEWQDRWELVPDVLADWSRLLGPSVSFPSLTHLKLATTARGLHHFLQLAPLIPNVTSVSWTCFWQSESDHNLDNDLYGGARERVKRFKKLDSLSVSGPAVVLRWMLVKLLRYGPDVRYLTICRQQKRNPISFPAEIDGIITAVRRCKQLVGLALFGDLPSLFLAQVGDMYEEDQDDFKFNLHIKSLVLEQPELPDGDVEFYPMIYAKACSIDVFFPSLEILTWVDHQVDSRTRRAKKATTYPDPLYDEGIDGWLDLLFENHLELRQVQWLRAYPTDPFVAITEDNWEDLRVRCIIPSNFTKYRLGRKLRRIVSRSEYAEVSRRLV